MAAAVASRNAPTAAWARRAWYMSTSVSSNADRGTGRLYARRYMAAAVPSRPTVHARNPGGLMPTKRIFDMVIIVTLLARPAFGLVKMAAARHSTHPGLLGTAGQAVQVMA